MQQSPATQIDSSRHFRVALVEKSAVPQGAKGECWYSYVIESGHSAITGWRRGSRQEITQYAIHCTEELNARIANGPLYRRKTWNRVAKTAEKSA
jgi:hypothetical protein